MSIPALNNEVDQGSLHGGTSGPGQGRCGEATTFPSDWPISHEPESGFNPNAADIQEADDSSGLPVWFDRIVEDALSWTRDGWREGLRDVGAASRRVGTRFGLVLVSLRRSGRGMYSHDCVWYLCKPMNLGN